MELRSYFQSDSDAEVAVGAVWLEDAVWNPLRIDPKKVPTGSLRMLPSPSYLRFVHEPIAAVEVNASLTSAGDTARYTMHFPSLERIVGICFGAAFPYTIFGWGGSRPVGWGSDARTLITRALLTHQIMEPYWEQNANKDAPLRESLGLPR